MQVEEEEVIPILPVLSHTREEVRKFPSKFKQIFQFCLSFNGVYVSTDAIKIDF